uniref:CD209 antigen-like protein 2 isoform X2 n=1 Tax=Ictidomys tridecemlineatus TaxID=43179 RepID=UPI001A9DEA25|nr:CD209 antigen-like protein 2 isoform X2 [Ictidomys tridecemlineatus]
MSDFKQVRVQQLDPLEEELAASSARGSLSHHALQPPSRAGSSAVSRVPSSQGQKVCQELTQLKAGVDRLCRPCPWDWTFFQGHCYFFSKSQRNWHDSATACQEEGAQLVVINSAEEQVHGGPHPGLGQASGHWPRGRRRWSEQGFQEQGLLPPVEGRRRAWTGGPRQLAGKISESLDMHKCFGRHT